MGRLSKYSIECAHKMVLGVIGYGGKPLNIEVKIIA